MRTLSSARGWDGNIRHWDSWRFHRAEPVSDETFAKVARVWEVPDGRVVGAVHPDGAGEAVLELDPGFRRLERAMVRWAEDHLASGPDDRGGAA